MTDLNIKVLVVGALLGVLIKILLEALIRRLSREWRFSALLSRFQEKAQQSCPKPYVDMISTVANRDTKDQVRTFHDLAERLSSCVQSGRRVFLMTGPCGIGKSFSCRVLASELMKCRSLFKSYIPCVVDATNFVHSNLEENLVNGLNYSLDPDSDVLSPASASHESRLSPVSREDLKRLLHTPRFVLILDGIDQVPFAKGVQSPIPSVLKLVENYISSSTSSSVLVIVVRTEFLRYNGKLQQLLQSGRVTVINFNHGFTLDQIEDYAAKFVPSEIEQRVQKMRRILGSANHSMCDSLQRPLIVESLMMIPLSEFLGLSSSGATMGNIYSIRYRRFSATVRSTLASLGYYLYSRDLYGVSLQPAFFNSSGLTLPQLTEAQQRTAALKLSASYVMFSHPSLRDYFASVLIVASLKESTPDRLLQHPTTFLISEMVASLLDCKTLDKLLMMVGLENTSDTVKSNVYDILSELEKPDLINTAQTFLAEDLKKHAAEGMSNYKITLLAAAGVIGNEKAIDELMNYLQRVGYPVFREQFFATRQQYQYYNKDEATVMSEWSNILCQPRYKFVRRLIATIFTYLNHVSPPEVLWTIANNENETDRKLRQLAKQSYEAISERLSRKAAG